MSIHEARKAKAATPDYPIHELIRQRWSPRAFADRPVEEEKLQSLFEAVRWSASSSNLQPWSFLVARRHIEPESFARMVDCLMPGNVPWAQNAPVLLIAVANLYRKPDVRNRHAFHDVGMALQNLAFQAMAFDLYLHMMGGFSPDKTREAFAIPADYEAVTMVALGYQGDSAQLADKHREGELAGRTRRPTTEFVFSGQWGETSTFLKA